MLTVQLDQVKPGDRLTQNVNTELGGVLFHKGTIITMRELEILRAFLVQQVVIGHREGVNEQAAASKPSIEETRSVSGSEVFNQEYNKMVQLLKPLFSQYTIGQALPIYDIRNQLETLLQVSTSYNVLTYLPGGFKEEDYLYHNSVLTALTSYLLAQWSGLSRKDWLPVALSGLLHDIGNVKVDKAILHKPTALTATETQEMRQHTLYGYHLLKPVAAVNEGVKLAVMQHHERLDGSGYPLGLKGEQIHAYAKIVAVADIYHAMTLQRIYRKSESPYLVLEQIQKESFGKLDPVLVQTFIEKTTQFNNGTMVRLSNGAAGEIIFTDRNDLTRPWVKTAERVINLTLERQLFIEQIIG
ncbi:HD-GYP domain-containing protein [Paenibacillaceae bacterium]|nr:HD-GYP domain-containing protein [Paenibacillaceae bacterium]